MTDDKPIWKRDHRLICPDCGRIYDDPSGPSVVFPGECDDCGADLTSIMPKPVPDTTPDEVHQGDVLTHDHHGTITVVGVRQSLDAITPDGPTFRHDVRFVTGEQSVDIVAESELIHESLSVFFEAVERPEGDA